MTSEAGPQASPVPAGALGRLARNLSWIVPLGAAVAFIAPFCFRLVRESDLGWHLAVGRSIARSGIPFRNGLTWTFPDEPWYATSWLFDWATYELAAKVGLIGVQSFMFVLAGLTVAGAIAAGRRLDPIYGPSVAPILSLFLAPRMTERPFVASWAVFAWVFWLCLPPAGQSIRDPGAAGQGFRRRVWCVPLIAVGSNLHSGVALSAILVAIFCGESFLLAGRRVREIVLAVTGFAALAANPGGLFNARYVIEHLQVQEVVDLSEFKSPTLRLAYLFYLLVAVTLVLAWRERRRTPALVVATVAFAAGGIWAMRLTYDFEVMATPVLALGCAALARRFGRGVAAVSLATAIALIIANRWELRVLAEPGSTWNERGLPVRAAEFIRAEHLDGRMYNGLVEGGYLEWALPELPWFQDARVQAFPPSFFKAQEVVDDSPEGFRDWLRQQNVEWAITTLGKHKLGGRLMLHDPDWALVYWDELSEVFVWRGVVRLQPVIARLEYRHFTATAPLLRDIAHAPRAELGSWKSEIDRFTRTTSEYPSAWLARCAVAVREGASQGACDHARELVPSATWKSNVDAARTIPVAP